MACKSEERASERRLILGIAETMLSKVEEDA
jgi:hypothetical protein